MRTGLPGRFDLGQQRADVGRHEFLEIAGAVGEADEVEQQPLRPVDPGRRQKRAERFGREALAEFVHDSRRFDRERHAGNVPGG